MGCYLCEQRGVGLPREDLGTCSRCSVRACSAHSTRYGRLQCAICAPGIAAAQAIAGVAIRAHSHGQVTSVLDGRGPTIPLEVLSAAVREAFAEIDPVEPDAITDDAVIVAAGALVMAVTVAHEPAASAIPPPWEMTHPALLDPVIWALATAYQLG